MRRLRGFLLLFALLAVGLMADWASHAGAAGAGSPRPVARRQEACPQLGVEPVMGRPGLSETTDPQDLPSAERPQRFDCGTGEAWRYNLP